MQAAEVGRDGDDQGRVLGGGRHQRKRSKKKLRGQRGRGNSKKEEKPEKRENEREDKNREGGVPGWVSQSSVRLLTSGLRV